MWASLNPGITVRPPRSRTCVRLPMKRRTPALAAGVDDPPVADGEGADDREVAVEGADGAAAQDGVGGLRRGRRGGGGEGGRDGDRDARRGEGQLHGGHPTTFLN